MTSGSAGYNNSLAGPARLSFSPLHHESPREPLRDRTREKRGGAPSREWWLRWRSSRKFVKLSWSTINRATAQPESCRALQPNSRSSELLKRSLCRRAGWARITPPGWAPSGPGAIGCFLPMRMRCICPGRRRARWPTRNHEAALVSYSPEQEMHTWWERALIPFIYCRLSQLYSYCGGK